MIDLGIVLYAYLLLTGIVWVAVQGLALIADLVGALRAVNATRRARESRINAYRGPHQIVHVAAETDSDILDALIDLSAKPLVQS